MVRLERWVTDEFTATNGLTKGKETGKLNKVGSTVDQSVLVNAFAQNSDKFKRSLSIVQTLGVESLVDRLELSDRWWRQLLLQVHLLCKFTSNLGPENGLVEQPGELVSLI